MIGVQTAVGSRPEVAEFTVSTERTLVSGAARIPACTNCCGSGVVHFRKESSSACTARG